ncbi:MAG TPA: bifunctional phosphoribosylaminoimidazolecarboxamide formyltransferase/IMP cyclohydrolase, partial [Acidovorax temperans]|nr:bifunctional phosphoribosylaminoimidazolecarboxamide formyltransferase/IMP cyclohydrolase [Acidovorax temperans]
RFALSVAAFNRIAQYDGAISDYLSSVTFEEEKLSETYVPTRTQFPGQSNGIFTKVQDLRYGENSHQQAALYRDLHPAPGSLVTGVQLQGKELSYNNIADADAAWECVKSFDAAACVIVKHANPCGVAVGLDALSAYSKAFQTDPTSAFGGIIAFNRVVDGAAAAQVSKQFVEVLMAPEFTPEALEIFKSKANVRLLKIALPSTSSAHGGNTDWERGRNAMDAKRIGSGLLLQTADNHELSLIDLKVVTKKQPTLEEMEDLLFAWKVAKYVKSNAIVFCKGGMTMGVGAGQMSRLDSARIASIKASHANLSLQGTVVASDAFFPFRDGLDVVVDAGATCVIQPGGSMRDQEVIDAANERGVAMVFSGVRHFRH